MPIEFFQQGNETRVRQSFDSPTVYMDHWAMMTFSEDHVLQDRFVSALLTKGGTLLVSPISIGEFAEPSDVGHIESVGRFLDRLMPNIYLTDFALDKVLARENLEVTNERRFWPPADLPQLKCLGEYAAGPEHLTMRPFIDMVHARRGEITQLTEEVVNMIRKGFEQARQDPTYVRRARSTQPNERRPRTLIIMGELMRGFNLDSGSPISHNDVVDFQHAVMPINCCDFVLLDGPWVGRVNSMSQRIAATGMKMPIAKCFSKTRNGGLEAFLCDLERFFLSDASALP